MWDREMFGGKEQSGRQSEIGGTGFEEGVNGP